MILWFFLAFPVRGVVVLLSFAHSNLFIYFFSKLHVYLPLTLALDRNFNMSFKLFLI